MHSRTSLTTAASLGLVALVLALAACAPVVTPGADPTSPSDPTPVVAQGTVLQAGDAAPQLCLGAIAESYPPQCSGIELIGWDWDSADGQETASDVTWGTYAVWGNWDGTALTVTSQIQLALYDPLPIPDPFTDPANAGTSTDEELADIQATITDDAPTEVLSSWIENGCLFVQVLSDDGSVQDWANQTYGENVVQVRSALKPVE